MGIPAHLFLSSLFWGKETLMKHRMMTILLSVTGFLFFAALFFCVFSAYDTISRTDRELAETVETIHQKALNLAEDEKTFSEAIATAQNTLTRRRQNALTAQQALAQERSPAPVLPEESSPSVFSEADTGEAFSDSTESGAYGDLPQDPSGDGSYGATAQDAQIHPPTGE